MNSQSSTTRALGALAALALGVAGSILVVAPAHAASDDLSIANVATDLPDAPAPTPEPAEGTQPGSGSEDAPLEIEAAAGETGVIRGEVRVGTSGSNTSSSNVVIYLYRDAGTIYEYVAQTTTLGVLGTYEFAGLEPGDYALEFRDLSGAHSSEYWQDSRYWGGRTDVTITADIVTVLPLTLLAPRTYDRERLAGADRFGTAVAISEAQFANDEVVPVIYIANGLNYPDALSAGPAAIAGGGGMLLVLPTEIPAAVAAELDRIDPQRIVIVGGTSAVNASVATALQSYVDSPSDVVRIGGADRYQTSRLLVQDAFDGVDDLFVATGTNFPDALAATPVAGFRGAPLLLVQGSANAIDSATVNLISSLGPSDVHVAGGPGAVSDAVIYSIYQSVPSVQAVYRYAGANRYETSVVLNYYTFGSADVAFLASGSGFADALAGGPFAGWLGAPMYLSQPGCVPADVLASIDELSVNGLVLLGGTGVLNQNVFNMVSCAAPADGILEVGPTLERELVAEQG